MSKGQTKCCFFIEKPSKQCGKGSAYVGAYYKIKGFPGIYLIRTDKRLQYGYRSRGRMNYGSTYEPSKKRFVTLCKNVFVYNGAVLVKVLTGKKFNKTFDA